MKAITIIGNPNTGKSTLFNSITRSNVHTGNWHGVTVEAYEKTATIQGKKYVCIDLPGLYSINSFSAEEKVSFDYIVSHKDNHYIYVVDANSLRRNLYLFMQLATFNLHIVLYINNYDIFKRAGGRIDAEKLSLLLHLPVIIGDASKQKRVDGLISEGRSVPIIATDEISKPNIVYKKIEEIYFSCVHISNKYIYGQSKLDKFLLNKWLFLPLFLLCMFFVIYFTFFTFGQTISNGLLWLIEKGIEAPIIFLLTRFLKAGWLVALVEDGIFASFNSVLSFLIPVCLLYVFLGLAEDSGVMARVAFMLDDWLNRVGLNGKASYTLLLGFGCNTTSMITARALPNRNTQIKTAILTPYMSCAAKLPIYSVIATKFFPHCSIWLVLGIYVLGVVVALILAGVLEKTILPTNSKDFLLEFPAIRRPSIKKVSKNAIHSAINFLNKVVFIVVGVSVIVWVLNNFSLRFAFVPNGQNNILPTIAHFISPLFSPLGFGAGLVVALLAGFVAKELILSSLILVGALSAFTTASAISFLVFCSLYLPCVSSLAVMLKFIGKKWTLFACICQFLIAYILSRLAYLLVVGSFGIIDIILIVIVMVLVCYALISVKHRKQCSGCVNCSLLGCKRHQK